MRALPDRCRPRGVRAWGRGLLVGALLAALASPPGFTARLQEVDSGAPETDGVEPVAPARQPKATRKDILRVGTFNIAWFAGEAGKGFVPREAKDLEQVSRVVRGTHAHLLALQEIVNEDALAFLVRRMNRLARGRAEYSYHASDGTALYWPGERVMGQEVGVIYDRKRVEVLAAEPVVGPEEGTFTRDPIHLQVKVEGSRVEFDVLAVHLKSGVMSNWAGEIREREVRAILGWLEELERAGRREVLMIGDFNAPRDHDTLALLDDLADAGELVAVEDHLPAGSQGTHIPWGVGLDRAFMTAELYDRVGMDQAASIYRFEEFLPGAFEKEFCIQTRYKVRDPEKRCDCPDVPDADDEPEDDEAPELPERCGGNALRWVKAANFVRVSDHRPLLWDLRVGRPDRRRRRTRRRK